jgi:hypothetical protein
MAIHRSTIKKQSNTSVAKHFNLENHPQNGMKVAIPDHCNDIQNLKQREAIWIDLLNTLHTGLNQRDEVTVTLHTDTLPAARHFKHSPTCWPYFLHSVKNIQQDDLKRFQRVILNKSFRKCLPTL